MLLVDMVHVYLIYHKCYVCIHHDINARDHELSFTSNKRDKYNLLKATRLRNMTEADLVNYSHTKVRFLFYLFKKR